MKRILYYCFLLLVVFGCEMYQTKFPIQSSSHSSIDENIVGEWIFVEPDSIKPYPFLIVKLLPFNDKEYILSIDCFGKSGQTIKERSTFKTFNSQIKKVNYFNVESLELNDKIFFLYKVIQRDKDSIQISFLTDSLKMTFPNSKAFRAFITKKDSPAINYWHKPFTFYRRQALTWNRMNPINTTDEFKEFHLIETRDKSEFLQLSSNEIEQRIVSKQSISIDIIKKDFEDVHQQQSQFPIWKSYGFAVIKLTNNQFIKIQYDRHSSNLYDLTNDVYYWNLDRLKWE